MQTQNIGQFLKIFRNKYTNEDSSTMKRVEIAINSQGYEIS